jgi:hypothetical protein
VPQNRSPTRYGGCAVRPSRYSSDMTDLRHGHPPSLFRQRLHDSYTSRKCRNEIPVVAMAGSHFRKLGIHICPNGSILIRLQRLVGRGDAGRAGSFASGVRGVHWSTSSSIRQLTGRAYSRTGRPTR